MPTSETGKQTRISRGFTLLELIIVLVIVGITLGYVGPRLFMGFSSSNLDQASRDIMTIIQFARSTALTQHTTYYLRFDIDNSWVGVYPKPESTGVLPEMTRQRDLPPGVRITGIKSPYQNEKEQGEVDLKVTPEGIVEQGVIYLDGGSGKTYTLVIKPFSGTVRVYDHLVEISYG
ncbi:MAG: GspH/FimT family pseudopilin [Desulfomonilia bacterium]